jgi:hypothetical protein
MRGVALLVLALTAGCAGMAKPMAPAAPVAGGPAKPPVEREAPRASTARPSTAHATPGPAAPAPGQPPARADAGPHLDLQGLEQRLKDTGAIGVFTKLALKNSVDDLLARFRAYHGGQQPPTLADLRPNYELLILKVQALIQKDDPTLAADVIRSREVIWSVLVDKSKFALI